MIFVHIADIHPAGYAVTYYEYINYKIHPQSLDREPV
jgi:hypothetical protein